MGAAVVLGLLGWGVASVLGSVVEVPDNHVAAADSRVCAQTSGNNLSLSDATRHFGLVLPADAADLVFTAGAGGLQGESNLRLRFATTPGGLAGFLAASHFGPASATTKLTAGGWTTYGPGVSVQSATGPCGLTPPVGPAVVYSQDGPGYAGEGSPRDLAVDGASDPAHPVVWVVGSDL